MASLLGRIGLAVTILGSGSIGASAAQRQLYPIDARASKPALPAPDRLGSVAKLLASTTEPAPALAPADLRQKVVDLARAFDGKAGIAIVSLRDGWEIDWNASTLFPQQSCSKLWVALTAMDAVDRGKISLDDRVTLDRSDLTVFHQPLRDKILASGAHTTTLGSLLFDAITESDNTANDKLMRSVGGPQAVRDFIARKGLGAIRFYDGERALQSRIAGLMWSQSYALGRAFYQARDALPMALRRAAFERYIADPYDGASPHAIAQALAALKRGELLSPASTSRLLAIMGQTRTGKLRVRAALGSGWDWNHKTGTGQELLGQIGGINDIGLLRAPDGSIYAMAIMTIPNRSDGGAQKLMQDVARAVIAAHERAPRR